MIIAQAIRLPKAKDAAARGMKACAEPNALGRAAVLACGPLAQTKISESCKSQRRCGKTCGPQTRRRAPSLEALRAGGCFCLAVRVGARHPLWPSLLCLVRLRPPEAPPILRCLLLLPRSTRAPYSNESPLVPRVALPPPKCDVREFLCVFRHRSCESPAVPASPRRQYTMLGRQRNVWGSPPSMVPPPRNKGTGQFGPCLATPSKW